ncbi:MAG: MATE family efflux transporter [Solobacterium sp.]|nr:MATE family efflux transporter [Solobacterium sp.]
MSQGTVKTKRVGRDLTSGPVFQSLMIFVLPIILTNLVQQLYSMVDLMVIGQYVGNVGTVGVSVGGEVSDFLTPVATSFATAGQILIAQLAGAKQMDKLRKSIGSFITMNMILSLTLMVLAVLLCKPILSLLNCPQEAFGQASSYLIITAIGLPFIFGYNAVCGILRGMGESKRPLIFIIVAAVVNIFLDLLLVIVFRLEAAGTAIATAASQLASFLAAFIYMYRNREQFGIELKPSYFKLDPESLKIIMKLGIPQACRTILVRVSMMWVNASVNSYGMVASGTNSVGNKLQKFLEIFSQSMSQASGAMIGQNLGAKKHDRAKQIVYYALSACLAVASVISLITLAFPHLLFGIFTKDPDVLDLGVIYLRIMIIHFLVSAAISAYQSMVIGAGNAPLNFAIGILDGVICKIGLSLIFVNVFHMREIGYFWGTALSRVLPLMICMIYFYSGRWKTARLIK